MNYRQARKIAKNSARSNRLFCKLNKMYPSYYNENGKFTMPSWHKYYLFQKAWIIIHRKQRKYKDKFKLL